MCRQAASGIVILAWVGEGDGVSATANFPTQSEMVLCVVQAFACLLPPPPQSMWRTGGKQVEACATQRMPVSCGCPNGLRGGEGVGTPQIEDTHNLLEGTSHTTPLVAVDLVIPIVNLLVKDVFI